MRQIAIVLPLMAAACSVATPQPAPTPVSASAAQLWLTTADQSQMLAQQADIISTGKEAAPTITIDPTQRFQTIQGFGAAITDASAELIANLPDAQRQTLLKELFGRENGGLGFSFTRLTVGASDFSRTHYSYDDSPANAPDPTLAHFSIEPARQYVLPVTRQALAINPDLKVMISPWSAPAWMKTGKSLIKGQLDPSAYPAFADYMARTVQSFEREGVPVAMLSIQNEPDFEPENYPGMRMSPAQRATVIGGHLGPLFEQRGIKTKILDWDHNWDKPEQPLAVLADPIANRYVTGIAWHCYAGDVPAQEKVRAAYPDKEVWFTECSGGNWAPKFGETLGWMASKLIIGSSNTGSRGTLLWNLALDPAYGPHNGGCGDCRGVVTIDPMTGAVTRNVEYYALAHASRFIRTGAVRIGAAASGGFEASAFANPDGSTVAIVYRPEKVVADAVLMLDGKNYLAAMKPGSVATIVWAPKGQ